MHNTGRKFGFPMHTGWELIRTLPSSATPWRSIDDSNEVSSMNVGFIGLGNVGSKLAGSLLRDGFALTVLDLRPEIVASFSESGAGVATTPAELTAGSDVIITSLPNPEVSATVLESEDGVLSAIDESKIWMEMSTTSSDEVIRLGREVAERGGGALDCPVSGGCHRAATGNISIFAGGDRPTFEACLPLLTVMGRRILHTGPLGSASILKVITNYLASANLVAIAEAMVVAQRAGMDLATTYEAIRISSGNSFVHETESQLILNGSRNINFTMDLVVKDMALFQEMAEDLDVPVELSPLLVSIFEDGLIRYGPREWSTNIIRRLEDVVGASVSASGFPSVLIDNESPAPGEEVRVGRSPVT